VFQNRVLRRIFGPKRNEVTGGWRNGIFLMCSIVYLSFNFITSVVSVVVSYECPVFNILFEYPELPLLFLCACIMFFTSSTKCSTCLSHVLQLAIYIKQRRYIVHWHWICREMAISDLSGSSRKSTYSFTNIPPEGSGQFFLHLKGPKSSDSLTQPVHCDIGTNSLISD
jgi:hypothetical protein